ncbi:MAG: hypothetical protein WD278_20850 [Pirellulales bacterium]
MLSPLGRQVAFSGRPTDVALSPDGRWLAVLSHDQVLSIDVEAVRVAHFADWRGGSYSGIVFAPDGRTLYASSIRGTIGVFDVDAAGSPPSRRSASKLCEARTTRYPPAWLSAKGTCTRP